MGKLVIRFVFLAAASLATLFVLLYGMSQAVKPFLPRAPVDRGDETLDYELADMPDVALPSASTPGMPLDTTPRRLGAGDANPAPRKISGRWLAGPDANHFQIDGRGRWLRLRGHTDELWAFHESHARTPQADSADAADDVGTRTGAPLCLEVELLGHLGVQESHLPVASITVEKVQSIELLDVSETECLVP